MRPARVRTGPPRQRALTRTNRVLRRSCHAPQLPPLQSGARTRHGGLQAGAVRLGGRQLRRRRVLLHQQRLHPAHGGSQRLAALRRLAPRLAGGGVRGGRALPLAGRRLLGRRQPEPEVCGLGLQQAQLQAAGRLALQPAGAEAGGGDAAVWSVRGTGAVAQAGRASLQYRASRRHTNAPHLPAPVSFLGGGRRLLLGRQAQAALLRGLVRRGRRRRLRGRQLPMAVAQLRLHLAQLQLEGLGGREQGWVGVGMGGGV